MLLLGLPDSLIVSARIVPLHAQSTFCDTLYQHSQTIGRSMHIVNLGEREEGAQQQQHGAAWAPWHASQLAADMI